LAQQDSGHDEWVNAWAETAQAAPMPKAEPFVIAPAAQPAPVFAKGRTQALTLAPARTTDAVPVMIGGVLALVMLTVFGAAAAMTKLVR